MILVTVVTLYTGCSKDDPAPKSDSDVQIGLLNGTWNATEVKLDNVPQTGYDAFTLTIEGTEGQTSLDYVTSNRPEASAWGANGTLKFGDNVKQTLIRDENSPTAVTITYGVTETTLQMEFTYSGEPISRTKNVTGVWEFTFEKAN